MLEAFRRAKMKEIASLLAQAEAGALSAPLAISRPDFKTAISHKRPGSPLPLIAEYKRASPSRGAIREDLAVEDVVLAYARAGAAAISILTEQDYFHGDTAFIQRAYRALAEKALPILRKDFIFHPLQVEATAATPASALLLIVRLSPDARLLRDLREKAESLGLACVVEIFDEADLKMARDSGASIIQANARDLDSLKVNRQACLELAKNNPPVRGESWIFASGLESAGHLRQAADAGFSAALVGTSLMASGDPGQNVLRLLAGCGARL